MSGLSCQEQSHRDSDGWSPSSVFVAVSQLRTPESRQSTWKKGLLPGVCRAYGSLTPRAHPPHPSPSTWVLTMRRTGFISGAIDDGTDAAQLCPQAPRAAGRQRRSHVLSPTPRLPLRSKQGRVRQTGAFSGQTSPSFDPAHRSSVPGAWPASQVPPGTGGEGRQQPGKKK